MNPGRSHEENQLCELFKGCLLSSFKLFVLHEKGRGKSSPQAPTQSPPTEQRRRGRTVAYSDNGPRARGWAAHPGGGFFLPSPYPCRRRRSKRKEPTGEETLVQLDDLRTLLKEERQSWKEELKHEFQGWSSRVNSSLEKFEGELSQVAGKIQTVQSSVEAIPRQRQAESSRVHELEKPVGAMETRSTTLGSHPEGEGERRRALIMGGWAEDNVASNTLESAKAMVAQLRLDIDFGEAFVPGNRRGYAIVPYTSRPGETEGNARKDSAGL